MSKLHRDNAGYVGCSYEEPDPYTALKAGVVLKESKKTVIRDEEHTLLLKQMVSLLLTVFLRPR